MYGMGYRGYASNNTITDTVEYWANLGPGYYMINRNGALSDQPATYGIILNLPIGMGRTDIHQIWFTQANGSVYHRGGNYLNTFTSWTPFSPGTATAAQVLKGYTFSSAAGSNLTGTYDPGNDYNNGYNAGYSAGNSNGYTNGYNAGRSQGQNDMIPNAAYLKSWTRDSTDAGSWTCDTSGYYVIFVYGMVNANRNMIPTISINGTYISGHDASTEANNHQHVYIYQINSGGSVSWSWNTNHGTYYWRNGVAIIRIK